MASLMDEIMRQYGGQKQQDFQVPGLPQLYGPLSRQLATEVPLPNGSLPGGALSYQLANQVPLPNGSLPQGALARQLATDVPFPSMPQALAPRMPDETGFQYRPSMNPALSPRLPDDVGFQYRPSMNPLANPSLNRPVVAGLDAANRPAPMASSTSAPAREQGFFEKLFKGPDYQSNNMPVNAMPQGPMPGTGATMPSYINWADPNNAADFFRADALLQQQNPAMFGLLGGNNG
jgi:hypothetical protein